MAEIKIGEVFGEVIERFKNEAEAKRVSVILRPVPAGAVVVSDRRLLKRIFSEIMDNSVTYARDGGEVAIAVEFQKEGLLVEIKDSGIGIAEEEEPLVFTKFFRGSNFDDTEIAGAGLGLFIARGYVKLLNGKIWFKSEANKGTSFFVLLPA